MILRSIFNRQLLIPVFSIIVLFDLLGAEYRSAASGNWQDPAIWQVSTGSGWTAATFAPDAGEGFILIQPGHSVLIRQSILLDEVQVQGRLEVASGVQISNGSAALVLEVLDGGIFWNAGTFSGDLSRVFFHDGSKYVHAWTTAEGRIPLAFWSGSSTLQISGYTVANSATAFGNWSQAFGNVEWTTPGLAGDFFLNGFLTGIRGDLVISNSGGRVLRFTDNTDAIITIGGDLVVRDSARFSVSRTGLCKSRVTVDVAGDMLFSSVNPLGSRFCEQGISVFRVGGSFRMSAGLLYFSSGSGGTSNSGADLRLKEDFMLLGGVVDASVAYSNRVGDLYFEGTRPQQFRRTGQVIGSFHYHVVAGSTLEIDDGHSIYGSTLEVGDLSGGATLVVRSTDPAGAIQKGQTGGGNIQVRTQFWRAGSMAIYGGLQRQFISSDHPSAVGIHTRIDNSAGVEVSAAGSTVICTGDLEVLRGDLHVSRHYLTVRGHLSAPGGRVLVNADDLDIAVGLTVDGTLAPYAGNSVVLQGSSDSNAGNAILFINGNLGGDGYISFSGPNTQLVIGGNSRLFDRRLPLSEPVQLESLTIDTGAGSTILEVDQPLQIGNWSASSGYTGGLFLRAGMLRMHAPVVVSSVCALTGGLLDFRGQMVELMRNIQVSPPAGGFMANESSILRVTSAFGGTDNTIAFSTQASRLGILELNRTADFTSVGNIRITPHLRINGPLTVVRKLLLTDGELLNDGGLSLEAGALLIRTPHAALAAGSLQPTGGPYRLWYTDGKSQLVLPTGPEASGNIASLRIDVSDSVILSGPVSVWDSLILDRGIFHNPSRRLTLAGNAGLFRNARSIFSGEPPEGDGYDVVFSGSGMVCGPEADGSVLGLVNSVSDTLHVNSRLQVAGIINNLSGVMDMHTDSVFCGSITNRSILFAPAWLKITGDLNQHGEFLTRSGTVEFCGDSRITGDAVFHDVRVTGVLHSPAVFELSGDLSVNGDFKPADGTLRVAGSATQYMTGDSVISINNLQVSGYNLVVKSPVRIRGVVDVSAESSFDAGADLVTLEANDGVCCGRIAPLPASAEVLGSMVIERFLPSASGYRYLAPPLADCSATSLMRDVWAKKILAYRELVPGNRNLGFFGWPAVTPLESGRGLAVLSHGAAAGLKLSWRPSGMLKFGLSRGKVSLPVSRTYSSRANGYEDGWNLVGNPYPSPIYLSSLDSAWTRKNISNAVFVPKLSGAGYYYYDPVSKIGDLPDGCIGTGQAFWTFATDTDPILMISELAKVKPSASLRSSPGQHNGDGYLALRIAGIDTRADTTEYHQIFLMRNVRATEAYDPELDFPAFPGADFPQISMLSADGVPLSCYATDNWPNFIALQLTSYDSPMLMSLDHHGYPTNKRMLLRDLVTGEGTNLEQGKWVALRPDQDGRVRYRLEFYQETADQQQHASPEISTGEPIIYPNPVKGDFFLVSIAPRCKAHISMRDIYGRLLSEQYGISNEEGVLRIMRPPGHTGLAVVEIVIQAGQINDPPKVLKRKVILAE